MKKEVRTRGELRGLNVRQTTRGFNIMEEKMKNNRREFVAESIKLGLIASLAPGILSAGTLETASAGRRG